MAGIIRVADRGSGPKRVNFPAGPASNHLSTPRKPFPDFYRDFDLCLI